jgi:hypothetical protein
MAEREDKIYGVPNDLNGNPLWDEDLFQRTYSWSEKATREHTGVNKLGAGLDRLDGATLNEYVDANAPTYMLRLQGLSLDVSACDLARDRFRADIAERKAMYWMMRCGNTDYHLVHVLDAMRVLKAEYEDLKAKYLEATNGEA